MRVRINGRELRVVKTTKVLIEWQHQSGMSMTQLNSPEGQVYSLAFMAFCALQNAGFEPKWDELLDIDTGDWVFIKEPSDERTPDAVDPASSHEDSEAAAVGGAKTEGKPASKSSTKPKGGSKTKSHGD